MHQLFIRVFAFITAFSFVSAQAAESAQLCQTPKVRLAFSNGISTVEDFAIFEAKRVTLRAGKFPQAADLNTEFPVNFYHQNNGFADLAEVFLQKSAEAQFSQLGFAEKSEIFFSALIGIRIFGPLASVLETLITNLLLPPILNTAAERIAAESANDLAKAKRILDEGDSLLFVAHSQGNLYSVSTMRQLYQQMPATMVDARVAYVGAGVPTHKLIGKGGAETETNYVTNTLDEVINALRLASGLINALQPIRPNVTSVMTSVPPADNQFSLILQHSFLGVYFDETLESGRTVVQDMASQVTALSSMKNQSAQSTSLAYTYTMRLTFPVSLAELFLDGPVVSVKQSGPLAASYSSSVIQRGDNAMDFETKVSCSLATLLPSGESPVSIGVIFPFQAGSPVISDVTLVSSAVGPSWKYNPGSVITAPIDVQGEKGLSVFGLSGMATKATSGQGFNLKPTADVQ